MIKGTVHNSVWNITNKVFSNTGIVLLIAVIIAMLWANSPWQSIYQNILNTTISFSIGDLQLTEPLLLWINDGLMALFFLQVGLELKREILSPGFNLITFLILVAKHHRVGEYLWLPILLSLWAY